MENEGSMPCLEDLDTCPFPEPTKSVHALLIYFFKIQFNICSHLRVGFHGVYFR